MIELLFVIISIFSSFSYGKQDYNFLMYKIDYQYTIAGEVSNYLLVNENCYKMISNNDYEYTFDGLINGQIYEENNQIFVFGIKDNKLIVNIFTKYGMFIEEKIIINNMVANYKIKFINNKVIVFGNIKNYLDVNLNLEAKNKGLARNDIIVFEFDNEFNEINHNLIGGKLNESVIDVTICDQKIYIVGKKDKETGGDLGYGGIDNNSVFIAKIDDNLEIENYIVLDQKIKIERFFHYNSNLYLSTNTNLFCISNDLKFLSNMKYLEEIEYSRLTNDNELITLTKTKGYAYDIIKMEIIDSFYYPEDFHFAHINFFVELDNYIMCEYDDYLVLLDIVIMKETKISNLYTKDKEIIEVSSVFGNCSLKRKEEEYYFDPLVCGKYPFSYILETKTGLEFSFESSQTIALEANVCDNGVYPLGYNLRFTGKAYLNDKIVINNYPLNIAGNYNLVLIDNNNLEKTINFTVSQYQRQIIDFYQDHYEYEINKGDSLELKFNVKNIEDEFIGLYVDDYLYDISKVDKEDNNISVKVNLAKEIGYHSMYIGSLVYKKNGYLYEEDINKHYYIRVNPLRPSFDLTVNADKNLVIEVEDQDNSLRSIRLILFNNSNEYYFDYPIHNGAIIINNVNKELYDFNIMIGYYNGGEIIYTNEIITGKIQMKNSELVLGNISLLNNYETVNKFSIKINNSIINNELERLSYLNNDIYISNEFSYLPVVIFSLVVGGVLMSLILFLRRKKLSKF